MASLKKIETEANFNPKDEIEINCITTQILKNHRSSSKNIDHRQQGKKKSPPSHFLII